MYANFMTIHVLFDEDTRKFDGTRAYNEKCSTDIFFVEIIEQFPEHVKGQCMSIYIYSRM